MARSLQDVLGLVTLTTFIETIKPSIPRLLPDSAYGGAGYAGRFDVDGYQSTYVKVEGRRLAARSSSPDGKAVEVNEYLNRIEVPVNLLTAFESQKLNPAVFRRIVQDGGTVSDPALAMLQQEVAQFRSRLDIFRTNAVHTALATGGYIYRDSTGQILPSSSGANSALTINYGVSATARTGTGTAANLGGLIAASWDTASTDIVSHLLKIQQQQAKDGKPPITTCLYGLNVPGYISKNNNAKEWINGNLGLAAGAWRGTIPAGFGGIKNWIPVHTAYLQTLSSAGVVSNTNLFGDNYLAFLPDFSADWYHTLVGSRIVSNDVNVRQGDSVTGAMQIARGQFAYGVMEHNPAGVNLFQGDTFLPVIADPDAVFLAGSATAA